MAEGIENGFGIAGWQVLPHANSLVDTATGQPHRISSKAMQVLLLLAARQGQFVARDDFLSVVWAERVVTEDVLTGAIRTLRRTLKDDPRNPRYIETRKGSGYRLIATLEPLSRSGSWPRWRIVAAVAAAAVSVLGLIAIAEWTAGDAATPTIAVLPFDSLSGSDSERYLASAMTDALILNLAERGRLRVISRTSVLPFAGERVSLQTIAKQLQADYIVEGSVNSDDDRLRISAQLIDGHRDTHVWASRYDRTRDDALDLQIEVADQIARRVVGAVADAPAKSDPGLSGDALQKLLKARYLLAQQNVESARQAQALYSDLARDFPYVADGHLGRAQSLLQLFKSYQAGAEALRSAEASVLRALELDPLRSEGYRCLAQIVQFSDWDLQRAEELYHRALELNPSDTEARRRYAWLLVAMQRFDAAMMQIDELRLLNPFYYASADGALLLMFAGDHAGAVTELERLNRETPSSVRTLRILSTAYWAVGRHDESVAALIESRIAAGNSPVELHAAFAADGRDGVFRYLLDKGVFSAPVSQAALHAQMGDVDSALEWLERALSERDPDLLFVNERPELAALRDHPRFQALVQQVSGSH